MLRSVGVYLLLSKVVVVIQSKLVVQNNYTFSQFKYQERSFLSPRILINGAMYSAVQTGSVCIVAPCTYVCRSPECLGLVTLVDTLQNKAEESKLTAQAT